MDQKLLSSDLIPESGLLLTIPEEHADKLRRWGASRNLGGDRMRTDNYGGGGIPQRGQGPYAKRQTMEVGAFRNLGRDRVNHRFVVHEFILL